MPRTVALTLLAILWLAGNATADATADADADADGQWNGAIELPGTQLSIAVSLTPTTEPAGWSGTIDIPAQGLHGFALAGVEVARERVHFEMHGVPGLPTFDGTMSQSGESITGTFTQGQQSFPFSLARDTTATTTDTRADAVGVPGEGAAGEWLGTLAVGPAKLRLALHVTRTADGSHSATLDSLDQGAAVAVATTTFEHGALRLECPAIGATFQGTLGTDGSAITGTWAQNGRSMPLTFLRQASAVTLRRPQQPVEPLPYTSRELVFRNQGAQIDLAGTFLRPAGPGPFPALVFASGSGPQDRDELIMGHRPFLVLADHLARHGIASLRFDDRGFAQSEGDHMGSTVSDFATDVQAAVHALLAQPEVDRLSVGILGHSEGGVSGPHAALAIDEVDFLVLLAPPAVPLDRLLARQTSDLLRQRGVDPGLIDGAVRQLEGDLELVQDATLDAEELAARLRARAAAVLAQLGPEARTKLGIDEASAEQSIALATTPWFRSIVRVDPPTHLGRLTIPVLALFGDKDLQVAATDNATALRSALAAAGNDDVRVEILPGLNHLFQHAETGGIDEYGAIEETMAPEVLELVTGWIHAHSAGH